jgi:hypothetical protein
VKKFLPYILILVIIANIFAPFTLSLNQKRVTIDKVVTEAADTTTQNVDFSDLGVGTEIKLETGLGFIKATVVKRDFQYSEIEFSVFQNLSAGQLKQVGTSQNINYTKFDINNPPPTFVEFKNLANGNYTVKIITTDNSSATSAIVQEKRIPVAVSASGSQATIDDSDLTSGTGLESQKEADVLPECLHGLTIFPDLVGCAIVIYYNVLFIPTSYLFGLGGKFFDATFGYSILDSSYRSSFVTEGWAIVRDFCNLFFIFVLIYAAFGMILSIHSIKAKEILINTIIIGLLINFSLFAGQVLIDASNILARVFYNSEAIKITVDKDGGTVDRGGVNMYDQTVAMGQLPLSAALVSKIDPQNLILNGKSQIQNVGDTTEDYAGLSAGGWFLIITLAVIVNIVGTFVFLSVGLIFVARVIGLWFALIFAPFAFFSYTVPQMQGVPMVGWKKWWPETMGLAFVAPIFMFFLYLILVFLQKGFVSLLEASKGPNFVLSIIIPFVFIMILLMTAKKLAKSYSGQMGQMITSGVAAVGAVALGGAALGAAFVGRTAIGRPLKAIANSDAATKHTKALKAWEEGGSIPSAKPKAGFIGTWGAAMNRREEHQGHIIHTRHELDDVAKKEFNGQSYGELGALQKQQVKDTLAKDKSEKTFNTISRRPDTGAQLKDGGGYAKDYKDLTESQKKEVRDFALEQSKHKIEHSADEKIGLNSVLQTSMRKGSYDVRNLSALGTNNMDSIFNKLGTKLMIGIGMGMRMGFKSSGINHGTGQKDFFKDIGNTITEALKNVKIEVPKGGGGGGHDDHGGGGDDHGHGGGGGGGHH